MGIVKFNGTTTKDLGLIVQFVPSYKTAEKVYNSVNIPGRNGELIIGKGSYQNVERSYSFAKVYRIGQDLPLSASAIMAWLNSADGYARLEDSYEPEYYRMAIYKDEGELYDYYNTATTLDVTFICKPERWLKSGEYEQQIQSGTQLYNPTAFKAKPIIKFTTKPNLQTIINIGDITITVKSLPVAKNIIVDCENYECYSDNNELLNSQLVLNSGAFPYLEGSCGTTITYSNADNFSIQPRWWTL